MPEIPMPEIPMPEIRMAEIRMAEIRMAEIRMATPADAPAIAAVYAPYVTDAVTSFESEPPGPEAMRERLENVLTTLGRGYGRLLYSALFEILRAQGYVNAFAGVALPNPASVGLHEAMGFTAAGVRHRIGFKHGRWIDVGDWEMSLTPHPAQQPPAPVPWSALPPETLRKTIAYP